MNFIKQIRENHQKSYMFNSIYLLFLRKACLPGFREINRFWSVIRAVIQESEPEPPPREPTVSMYGRSQPLVMRTDENLE